MSVVVHSTDHDVVEQADHIFDRHPENTVGGDAVVREGEGTLDGGKWQHFALSWPEVVIGGGTPNIQKNIIAERILGLPKD